MVLSDDEYENLQNMIRSHTVEEVLQAIGEFCNDVAEDEFEDGAVPEFSPDTERKNWKNAAAVINRIATKIEV